MRQAVIAINTLSLILTAPPRRDGRPSETDPILYHNSDKSIAVRVDKRCSILSLGVLTAISTTVYHCQHPPVYFKHSSASTVSTHEYTPIQAALLHQPGHTRPRTGNLHLQRLSSGNIRTWRMP